MGWIEKKFEDHLIYSTGKPVLWNKLRDSIGGALLDFTTWTGVTVQQEPCTANGEFCIRVHKPAQDGTACIEVFLDGDCLKTSGQHGLRVNQICDIRIAEDRTGLEFCGGAHNVSVEDACRWALEDFLFDPFPKFKKPLR